MCSKGVRIGADVQTTKYFTGQSIYKKAKHVRLEIVTSVWSNCIMLILALQKKPEEINRRSADMWSFAILLWELVTREVPFADLSNMEIGMKVRKPLCDSSKYI